MRVLILTGDEARHLHLIDRLHQGAHDVTAWMEEKGRAMNDAAFLGEDAYLLEDHRDELGDEMDIYFPDIDIDDLPLTTFPRGAFNSAALAPRVREIAPDLMITYGCGIVAGELLDAGGGRVIGSHQGLPQYYRGSGSNFFAFLEGRACRMGISLHRVDRGIDTGAVLLQRAPRPEEEDTYYSFSASLIWETLDLYESWIRRAAEAPSMDAALAEARPLTASGKLFQRADFTPDALRRMRAMLNEKPFIAWYRESLAEYGPPQLV